MRVSHIELLSAAAQRLKVLLPSLSGVTGSVQSEVFIIYSTLKYLSKELQHMSVGSHAKYASAQSLNGQMEGLVDQYKSESWVAGFKTTIATAFREPVEAEPLTDHLVDVALILESLLESGCPVEVTDQVMGWIGEYLAECNSADLEVYR